MRIMIKDTVKINIGNHSGNNNLSTVVLTQNNLCNMIPDRNNITNIIHNLI